MSLLTDDTGKIIGIVATKADGGKLTVRAKAVILCTGGFGGNEDMLKQNVTIAPLPKLAEDMQKLIASGGVAYKADNLEGASPCPSL